MNTTDMKLAAVQAAAESPNDLGTLLTYARKYFQEEKAHNVLKIQYGEEVRSLHRAIDEHRDEIEAEREYCRSEIETLRISRDQEIARCVERAMEGHNDCLRTDRELLEGVIGRLECERSQLVEWARLQEGRHGVEVGELRTKYELVLDEIVRLEVELGLEGEREDDGERLSSSTGSLSEERSAGTLVGGGAEGEESLSMYPGGGGRAQTRAFDYGGAVRDINRAREKEVSAGGMLSLSVRFRDESGLL